MARIPQHLVDNMRWLSPSRPCPCGGDEGEGASALTDARGIHVALVCDACVVEKAKGFRREIFENRRYEADDLGDEA